LQPPLLLLLQPLLLLLQPLLLWSSPLFAYRMHTTPSQVPQQEEY
jgi:hypothetical protein